ncbi:MAG: 30S ribosomal protein S20 [Candidatus Margulisbacteria bacterium]|nr:30S ribosomal protein S20 [Candidatus Margulisiibacteriota bacterium]
MAERKVKKRKGIKNVRKTKRRHARNLEAKKDYKLILKNARTAIAAKAADMAEKVLNAISVLDKMAERKIIHPNKASRLKSRLMLAQNKAK